MIKSIEKYQTIGIIGISKNTGKTTTLNAFIEFYKHEQLGLTSIGLDGESIDQVNFLPKPRIRVYPNMICATAKECLQDSHVLYEVLEETSYLTPIGNVLIVEIKSKGNLVVAGPSTNRDMNHLLSRMKTYVKRIFVDGALSRMTFSQISELDGIVLATGASFSSEMIDTIHKTKHLITMFSYPKTEEIFDTKASFIIKCRDHLVEVPKKLSIMTEEIKKNQKEITWIYVKGAVTEKLMDTFIDLRLSDIKLICEDPTKLLFHYHYQDVFDKLGIHVEVIKQIPLIMLTVNPYRPVGISYDPIKFENEIRALTQVPVINVKHLEVYDGK